MSLKMHPPFYLMEALVSAIYSHDILEKDIGFVPRIFQVTLASGVCEHSLPILKAAASLLHPLDSPLSDWGDCGSLVLALGIPVWLQGRTFAEPLRTGKCHRSDLTESSSSAPASVQLEPPYRPHDCHACHTFLWTLAGLPTLAEKEESKRAKVL